jgi:hypothetical protein
MIDVGGLSHACRYLWYRPLFLGWIRRVGQAVNVVPRLIVDSA